MHRPSVPFNCIKPPLRHSSQSICLLLARFDQGHIHRQRIFFHEFYYHVKPPSDEYLACGFGSYPGFAGKGVRDPFMDTGRITEQMQGGTTIDRLSIIWKPDLTDKMKRSFFQAAVVSIVLSGCTTWTLKKRLKKKLDGNYTRMLRAILDKSWRQHPTRHQLYGRLPPITKTIQVR